MVDIVTHNGLWVYSAELVPRALPIFWSAPNGISYSGLQSLPETEEGLSVLNSLGWFPVELPDLPIWAFKYGTPVWDSVVQKYIAPPESISDEEKISRMRTLTLSSCKAERNRRIELLLGDSEQQMRTLADAITLLNLVATGVTLTESQLVAKATLEAAAVYRIALSTAEATVCAAIQSAVTLEELLALYDTMPTNPSWPA